MAVADGDGDGDGLGPRTPTEGDGLTLGLGLGDAVPGDWVALGRLVRLGAGLVWRARGWVGWTWLGVGDGATPGESALPDPVVVDGGATST